MKDDPWQALTASGRVAPPTEASDLLDEGPEDYGIEASGRLTAMRDQER